MKKRTNAKRSFAGRALALTLAAVLAFSLCACGDAGSGGQNGSTQGGTAAGGTGQGGSGQNGDSQDGAQGGGNGEQAADGSGLQVIIYSRSKADIIIRDAHVFEPGSNSGYEVICSAKDDKYEICLEAFGETGDLFCGFATKDTGYMLMENGYRYEDGNLIFSVDGGALGVGVNFYDVTEYSLAYYEHGNMDGEPPVFAAADVTTDNGNGGGTKLEADMKVIQYSRGFARFLLDDLPAEWNSSDTFQIMFSTTGKSYCIRIQKNEDGKLREWMLSKAADAGENTEFEMMEQDYSVTFLSDAGAGLVVDMKLWSEEVCLDDVESFTLQFSKNNGYDGQAEKVFAAADVVEYPVLVCDGYKEDGDGGVVITHLADLEGYDNELTYVAIPDTVDGKPVTVIGDGNEFERISLGRYEKIVLPDTVVEIGNNALSGSKLLNINFPKSLKRIGTYAFASQPLKSITIPASVTEIGEYAFAHCEELESVTILGGNAVLEGHIFEYCTNLKSVDIDAKTIGSWLFSYSDSAFSAKIKAENIMERAFNSCGIVSADIHAKNVETDAFAENGKLVTVRLDGMTETGKEMFLSCTSLQNVELSEGMKTIGERTFWGCGNLKNISFPNSMETIGQDAFVGTGLTSIFIPEKVKVIGSGAFSDCDGLDSVTIPGNVKEIGDTAFGWCENLKSVEIQSGVEKMGDKAFFSCPSLHSVTIPDTVASIGDKAFAWCISLKNISIPSGAKVGNGIFEQTPLQ